MSNNTRRTIRGSALAVANRLATIATVLSVSAVAFISPQAIAQDGTGDTIVGPCMDDLFPGTLGCTANDVRVSGIADVSGDGLVNEDDITFAPVCDAGSLNAGADCSTDANICLDQSGTPAPQMCGDRCAFPGDTTTFATTFIVELSAQERYDIGLYFDVGGDPEGDGALTGTCSISTLPETGTFDRPDGHPAGNSGMFVDLDTTCKGSGCPQPGDLCGDIDDSANPIFYDLASTSNFITATCIANPDTGNLVLPSCTSWRQSGANELCLSPLDAFPGSPSKCNCDDAFELPIEVPPAELLVVKTATPTTVNEPGGNVQFDVSVTNTGVDPNNDVTLNSLTDSIYGDITTVQGDIVSTTCSVTQTITPGGTYTCSFTATVTGNGGDTEVDVVTAAGVDDNGNEIGGMDDATVDIIDLQPAISVEKTASPTSVEEGSGTVVTFSVTVDNDSVADPLTVTALSDDIYGDITMVQGDILSTTCTTGQTIALGGSYSCTFTAVVDGPAFSSETDTVTATGQDDETPANEVSAMDSATVTVTDNPAAISLVKTANPTQVNEPGDDVTFSFTITNLSSVDSVTINSFTDTIYGDLNGKGDCSVPQLIAPSGSYSCSFMAMVSGNAGDSETNVATASGVDDDGQPVMASDDATVMIVDVPPAASLTKTATMAVVSYDVAVTNDSSAEALDLTDLSDDMFGDITVVDGVTILSSDCAVPQSIAVGATYECSFDAKVGTSPHTNTVTGTVSDDDGNSVNPAPSDDATVTFE